MTLVCLTMHNENIKDIEKDLDDDARGSVRLNYTNYVSIFNRNRSKTKQQRIIDMPDGTKLLTNSCVFKHRSMGEAEAKLRGPCNFLKKNGGVKWRREKWHVCDTERRQPPVPKRDPNFKAPQPKYKEEPKPADLMELHCPLKRYFRNHKHRENFVKLNIAKAKNLRTCQRVAQYAYTNVGDTHRVANSGLVPLYIHSVDYGKIPCYLVCLKSALKDQQRICRREEEQLENMCMNYMNMGIRPMEADEREQLLEGLKNNWEETMKRYSAMSLYNDTYAKILKKGKLEDTLRSLENDISVLKCSREILVCRA